jgi:hypothetical protein
MRITTTRLHWLVGTQAAWPTGAYQLCCAANNSPECARTVARETEVYGVDLGGVVFSAVAVAAIKITAHNHDCSVHTHNARYWNDGLLRPGVRQHNVDVVRLPMSFFDPGMTCPWIVCLLQ